MSVTVAQDTLTDIAAFHLALVLSPADISEDKAGVREMIQQLMLNRLREAIKPDGELKDIAEAIAGDATFSVSSEAEYVEARVAVPSDLLVPALEAVAEAFYAETEYSDEEVAAAQEQIVRAFEHASESVTDRTYRLFRRALLGKSPLSRGIATTLQGIAGLTLDDIHSLHKQLYLPARSSIALVTPLPDAEVRAIVTKALAGYGYPSGPLQIAPVSVSGESSVQIAEGSGMALASMVIGVPLPGYGSRDFVAGQVAFMLLGGRDGRIVSDPSLARGMGLALPQSVYEKQPAVEMIAPGPMSVPFIAAHVVANPAFVEDVRVCVLNHFAAIAAGEFTEEELVVAREALANQYAIAYDTYSARAQFLNLNAVFGGTATLYAELPKLVDTITAEDVERVARENFTTHAVGLQLPQT
jgi:predicted Zn-dependent peptidase